MESAPKKIKAQEESRAFLEAGVAGTAIFDRVSRKPSLSRSEREIHSKIWLRVFLSGQFFFFITMKFYLSKHSNQNMLESMQLEVSR